MGLLLFLLVSVPVLILSACFTVVLLAHVLAWYEYANAAPELMRERFRPAHWRMLGQVMLGETLILSHLVLLWPLGLLPEKSRPLTARDTPVLLLHGLFQNRICWWWFARQLRRRGHPVLCHTISPWHNIEACTEILDRIIDRLRHRHGIRQVVLVGHSMGGIIARNYVQLRGGEAKVAAVVQIGAPNQGSKLAPFALSRLGVLLVPGTAFLQRLNAAPLPAEVPFTSIYSRRDTLVLPAANGHLPGARNIENDGLGHTALLFSPKVVRQVHHLLPGPAA